MMASEIEHKAYQLGMVVRSDHHAHDSRPGSHCVTVALDTRGRQVHINIDGHQLDPEDRTLWLSSKPADPPATARGDDEALIVARLMLDGHFIACDYCGRQATTRFTAEQLEVDPLTGERPWKHTHARCEQHAIVWADLTRTD